MCEIADEWYNVIDVAAQLGAVEVFRAFAAAVAGPAVRAVAAPDRLLHPHLRGLLPDATVRFPNYVDIPDDEEEENSGDKCYFFVCKMLERIGSHQEQAVVRLARGARRARQGDNLKDLVDKHATT